MVHPHSISNPPLASVPSGQLPTLACRPDSPSVLHEQSGPSALSTMMLSDEAPLSSSFRPGTTPIGIRRAGPASPDSDEDRLSASITPKATPRKLELASSFDAGVSTIPEVSVSSPSSPATDLTRHFRHVNEDERSPLLPRTSTPTSVKSSKFSVKALKDRLPARPVPPTGQQLYQHVLVEPFKAIPAVCLGLLLNVLDGVSC